MPESPLTPDSTPPAPQGSPASAPLEFQDWGLVAYDEALSRMMNLAAEIAEGRHGPGVLVFCKHPPVVTLGRVTQPGDVFAWDGPTVEVQRGGRATYHGPSQLVFYPLVNLKPARKDRGPQEISGFLRAMENAIIEALAADGIAAVGRSRQKKSEDVRATDETGVWVGDRKIASLGLGVKRWVSIHGAALNVDHDPKAFAGMNPCGFKREVMVSLEEIKGRPVDRPAFENRLKEILLRVL